MGRCEGLGSLCVRFDDLCEAAALCVLHDDTEQLLLVKGEGTVVADNVRMAHRG